MYVPHVPQTFYVLIPWHVNMLLLVVLVASILLF
jgi:hypothetical protein